MGRKSRNTAKTGDVAIYNSRDKESDTIVKEIDNDNMFNEVDRYHNANNALQDDILKFDNHDDDDSEDGGGGVDQQENVFDLGLDESDDDDDDDDDDDSEDSDESRVDKRGRRVKESADDDDDDETPIESDDDDDDDDSSLGDFEAPETDVLNWGKKKRDYYHGDTADLELGQEVEDAELEEEAGREVLKTRMEGMVEEDFMLDDDDDESDSDGKEDKSNSKSLSSAITSTMQKNLSKLSRKEKIKLMEKTHPELLPLITHFREETIRPCVNETLVVTNAMFQNKDNVKAVGATNEGLKYLITKAMLETSTALNVCQYLLIKAENANRSGNDNELDNNVEESNNSNLIDDQDEDDIKNHPVINRLNQLNHLRERLESDVESKVTGLKDQVENLAKASTLMFGDDFDEGSSDYSEDEVDHDEDEGLKISSLDAMQTERDQENGPEDDDASLATSSSDEEESAAQVQKNVMNEARFALRAQDDMHLLDEEGQRSFKRRRHAVPSNSDFGDEDDIDQTDLNKAAMSLASTVNTISQRTKHFPNNVSAEGADDQNEERFARGLEMMEEQLGGDDNDIVMDGNNLDDDLDDDDEEDFYSQIKKKSKEKKEYKKNLYAVAPKYPGMDNEIEGERSVGQLIMKNRGLVAHKSKMNRNPRVKKREQYRKAIIRRKGAVRDVRTEEGHKYGGEETGIKSGLSRSRKL